MKSKLYILLIVTFVFVVFFFDRPVTGNDTADKALKVFSNIMENSKSKKTYHMELKHFGFKLEDSYMIEWTKNTKVNELDLLMVLDANDFKNVGVKVEELKKDFIYKVDTKTDKKSLIHYVNISNSNKISYGSLDGMRRLLAQKPELVSYNENKYYSLDLNNQFEIRFNSENKKSFVALVVNMKELVENGLLKDNLPEGWFLLDDNRIIRNYNF